ncbi:MAG TPA: FAD-binding protein, partial [Acidiferrobacterales bacterium]|nr:FAD-binding protein [Acidiferrobacterales bacterium]
MRSPQTLTGALRAIVGPAAVLDSEPDMAPYLEDWRGRYRGRARCIVKPASTDEVAQVVRLLARHGVPIVPQGGNTGLCGAATPDGSGEAVVVVMSR